MLLAGVLIGRVSPAANTWETIQASAFSVHSSYRTSKDAVHWSRIGSGFLVGGGSHAVTCDHVTDFSRALRGELMLMAEDGRTLNFHRPIQTSSLLDITIFRVSGASQGIRAFRPFTSLRPGEKVWVIGAPQAGGLRRVEGTLRYAFGPDEARNFFARSRDVRVDLPYLIVHDAPLVHGDSGGMLLDENLDLVAMNFAAAFPQQGKPSIIAFAIPIEVVLNEFVVTMDVALPEGMDRDSHPLLFQHHVEDRTEMQRKLDSGEWVFEMAHRDSDTSGTLQRAPRNQ